MLTSMKKRVARILTGLTPKQYALIWVDEVRQFNSYAQFSKSQLREPPAEWLSTTIVENAANATRHQTVHLGPNDEARAVRNAIRDVVFLRHVTVGLNDTISGELARLRPQAAAVARMLQLTILHDVVSEDVTDAIRFMERLAGAKSAGASGNVREEFDALAARLQRYSLRPAGKKPETDASGLGPAVFLAYLRQVRQIRDAICGLLRKVYTVDSAAQTLSSKYFDGKPILFRNVERALASTHHWVESVVAEYNKFVHNRIEPAASVVTAVERNEAPNKAPANAWVINTSPIRRDARLAQERFVEAIEDAARGIALAGMGDLEAAGRIVARCGVEDDSCHAHQE